MPHCEYCGKEPYVTYCASYFAHVRSCRTAYERAKERAKEEMSVKKKKETTRATEDYKTRTHIASTPSVQIGSLVINNIMNNVTTINNTSYNIVIENMYVDYPKNNFTEGLLRSIQRWDVKQIKNVDDYNKAIVYALESNNSEIEKTINGANKRARSQALSFMADYSRTLRRRLEAEKGPEIQDLIEDVKEYENDLLQEKNQLDC